MALGLTVILINWSIYKIPNALIYIKFARIIVQPVLMARKVLTKWVAV